MSVPLKLFVDTNVWLDYYLDRGSRHDQAARIVISAAGESVALYVTEGVLKDFFLLFRMALKDLRRADGDEIDSSVAASIDEAAWACLNNIMHLALVVPMGTAEVWEAFSLRRGHGDFEDDLLIAAARRAGVDYLVTSDQTLIARSPVPCLDVADVPLT